MFSYVSWTSLWRLIVTASQPFSYCLLSQDSEALRAYSKASEQGVVSDKEQSSKAS